MICPFCGGVNDDNEDMEKVAVRNIEETLRVVLSEPLGAAVHAFPNAHRIVTVALRVFVRKPLY